MKNGIIRRMTALLLTMVCIITATPEALLTTYADEIQETEVLEQTESETEEAEYTEQLEIVTEETEYMAEQPAGTEIAEEIESIEQTEISIEEIKGTEQVETVTEKIESTEQTEIVTDNTENSEQSEVPTEKTKQSEEFTQSEINEQETQITEIIMETEIVSETEVIPETELILENESVSEDFGIMLLADEEETVTAIDAAYTDTNGITYSYYGYEDGTANIYAMAGYNGKEVAIPSVIDGYAVTQITAQLSYGAQLISLWYYVKKKYKLNVNFSRTYVLRLP